jgi:hypothetical protein
VLSFYDRFKKVKGLTKVLSPSFSILSFFKFFYSHYYLFLNLKLYFYSKYLPVSSLFNTLKSKNHLSADISKFYLSLNEKYPLFFKFFLKPQFFKFFFSVVPVKQTKVLKNRIKIYLYYIFKSVILQSNVLNIKNVYLFWQLKLKYLTSFDLFKLFYSNLNLINLNTNFLNFKHIICQFSWFYEFFMILKIKTLKRKSLFTFLKIQNKYKIKKKKKSLIFFKKQFKVLLVLTKLKYLKCFILRKAFYFNNLINYSFKKVKNLGFLKVKNKKEQKKKTKN